MNDEKSEKFKISFDEETPDQTPQEEAKNIQVNKLNRRITLVTVLMPILMIAMLVFAYFETKKGMIQKHDANVSEVQDLSEDFDIKIASLATQIKELGESLSKDIADIEKQIASIDAGLKKSQKSIETLDKNKADKKDQANVKGEIEKALSPALENMKKLNTDLTRKADEIEGGFDTLKNDIKKTNSDLANLSNRKLDKEILDLEFLKEKKSNQVRFEKFSKEIESKIKSLENKLNQMSRKLKSPRTSSETPPAKANKKTISSGGIVEEKINE